MIKAMLNRIVISIIIIISLSCSRYDYSGIYTRPRHVKLLGEGITLFKDSSYSYFFSGGDYPGIIDKKGNYKMLNNKLIVFHSDSIRDSGISPYRMDSYSLTDTFYILKLDRECILYNNTKCFMKLRTNGKLDESKYQKFCRAAKHGH